MLSRYVPSRHRGVVKVKAKFTVEKAMKAHRRNFDARWRWVANSTAALALGKTRYPLYKRLGGPQGRSGWVWKSSLPPGFNPRTVQPVASRYTD